MKTLESLHIFALLLTLGGFIWFPCFYVGAPMMVVIGFLRLILSWWGSR